MVALIQWQEKHAALSSGKPLDLGHVRRRAADALGATLDRGRALAMVEQAITRPLPPRIWKMNREAGLERVIAVYGEPEKAVHRAVAKLLHQRADKLFHPANFGYRPGRCAKGAAWHLADRAEGDPWVARLDVARCFPSVRHRDVRAALARLGLSGDLAEWLDKLLLAFARLPGHEPGKGLAQGSPLSPILANLVLDRFDRSLSELGLIYARFADDVTILRPDKGAAKAALSAAVSALEELGLGVNTCKSGVMPMGKAEFLGFGFRRNALGRWTLAVAPRNVQCLLEWVEDQCRDIPKKGWGPVVAAIGATFQHWKTYHAPAEDRETIANLCRTIQDHLRLEAWRRLGHRETRLRWLAGRGIPAAMASSIAESRQAPVHILRRVMPGENFARHGLGAHPVPIAAKSVGKTARSCFRYDGIPITRACRRW